jgi:hypothetical protein
LDHICEQVLSSIGGQCGSEVERARFRHGLPRKKKCLTPFNNLYQLELDVSPELAMEGHQYFRLGILLEVALFSAYLACPQEGHLEAAFHIFGYLKHEPKRKLTFDPDHPKINQRQFKKYGWIDF